MHCFKGIDLIIKGYRVSSGGGEGGLEGVLRADESVIVRSERQIRVQSASAPGS